MIPDREEIRRIILEVIRELSGRARTGPGKKAGYPSGPRVLAVFHGGLRLAEEALAQVRRIEAESSKLAVYTVESTRGNICGGDVRERAGVQCILDTVRLEGLEKVLDRSDLVLAPTFCLMTASKVSRLTCDDPGSNIILKALARNKKVLAANDGFQIVEGLVNRAIASEMKDVLNKLEAWGMDLCPTAALFDRFTQLTVPGSAPDQGRAPAGLKLVSAKDVNQAFTDKKKTIEVMKSGIVTPLAGDLAREYAIEIVRGGE